ncbi:energy-coupling factor transport system ATP-binding protein [Ruminococcus flavefaciens]|uniref:Energy-coupling factor transport system ATP-binding protein n=1 Tax=Ruminococcus flavefaciens TaxID=1265 RepID=A0A1H6LCQ3_RUMFL|nr:ABC transporter ATP-binding protein [Ruminococcus flavefaciens]SEH82980.1 energy-coupling factor transport system ATP-binding protein [Ruminococcus flavefaciens]
MMQTIAQINNVTHRYKGAAENSLDGVSLTIKKGETLLLCGASGSGKTSVIRLLNGLIPHYYQGDMTGEVTVNGLEIAKTQLYELAGIVGTVFQNPRSQFFSVDTDGEIVFGPENIGLAPDEIKARKDNISRQMKLDKLLCRSLFELSGGEKQRIACASVAALLPEIILLDEPSSNLDMEAINILHDIICDWKRQGKTIIISEHRLWYLKDIADRDIYMDKGRIVSEWSAEDFAEISEEETRQLGLRPTSINEHYLALLSDNCNAHESRINISDGILFKDFYFSYHRKPYILRRKRFSAADGEDLSLCIPELTIPKGKVTAVIGSNGTGKSTFLRCICGLEKDCTGVIISGGSEYRKRQRIGFSYMVMQDVNHQLFTDSVEKEVLLSMKDKDEKRCLEILDTLGLLRYKDTHPMALSGGQKQRVAIASAIAAGAELLLFDEPTSGLDYAHMKKVGELLRQLADSGSTVLVSTHDPEFIEQCCDLTLRIKNGRAVSLTF